MRYFQYLLLITLYTLSHLYAQVSVPLDDPRIAYEGVWFAEINADSVIFNRHSSDVLLNPEVGISSASRPYAYTQSGIRIRIKTASPEINVSFSERPEGGQMGLHNGFAVYAGDTLLAIFETLSFTITAPRPDSSISYRIILPSLHAVNLTGLELVEGFELDSLPDIDLPVYVAIGNSITHGTGHQSASFLTYPFVLAEEMDWYLVNLAVAGARTGWPIAQLTKDKDADIISIATGFNDWMWDNKSLSYKQDQYNRLLDTLRYYHPEAIIFCITPLYTASTSPALGCPFTLQDFRDMVKMIVRDRGRSGDSRLFLINGDEISDLSLLMDGIHLSETGAPAFAANLEQAMREILNTVAGTSDQPIIPGEFRLEQNYPNPFNPITRIRYSIPGASSAVIQILDLRGAVVNRFQVNHSEAGDYELNFDGSELSSGIYFIRMVSGQRIQTRKMLLLK